nr:hypothetical protein [Cupriavidus gilardii]
MKPKMVLQWHNEAPKPIARESAAHNIRANRAKMRAGHPHRIRVFRQHGETYIVSEFLGVGCCIGRA